jgi:hypothetical protein
MSASSFAAASSEGSSGPADVLEGYANFVRNKRSVLLHPVGLPLVSYFHHRTKEARGGGGGSGGDEAAAVKDGVHDFFPSEIFSVGSDGSPLENDDGGVFLGCHEKWIETMSKEIGDGSDPTSAESAETALTKELRLEIGARLGCSFNVPAKETTVPDPATGGRGRVDILVLSKEDSQGDVLRVPQPLLMMEVGLANDLWWKKFNQATLYLHGLLELEEGRPMLLAVVTLTDPKTNIKAAKAAAFPLGKIDEEKTDADKAKGKEEVDTVQEAVAKDARIAGAKEALNANFAARIGVFVVTKRRSKRVKRFTMDKAYRIALLWHKRADSVEGLSKQFGLVIGAARLLPIWVAASKQQLSDKHFAYLGPNCCKVVKGQVRPPLESSLVPAL